MHRVRLNWQIAAGFWRQTFGRLTITMARKRRVVVALGGVAHRALCSTLGLKQHRFAHAAVFPVHHRLSLVSSFHPSRLNVNTGRLTAPMMDEMFQQVRKLL